MHKPKFDTSDMSGVNSVKTELHLAITPKFAQNLNKGILEHLEGMLYLYSERIGGVPVTLQKVQKLHDEAHILEDQPFLHLDILAEFLVFQPEVGSVLRATVNKTGKDYIGCLVHGQFNGSVHKPYNSGSIWPGHGLRLGDQFLFKVLQIFTNYGVLTFKGAIEERLSSSSFILTDTAFPSPSKHTKSSKHTSYAIPSASSTPASACTSDNSHHLDVNYNGLITIAPIEDCADIHEATRNEEDFQTLESAVNNELSVETAEDIIHKTHKKKKHKRSHSHKQVDNENSVLNDDVNLHDSSLEETSFQPPAKRRKKSKVKVEKSDG